MVRSADKGGPVIAFLLGVITGYWLTWATRRRSPCWWYGHTWRWQFSPTRMYLRCDLCGDESPGWQLFGLPPGCERLEVRRP